MGSAINPQGDDPIAAARQFIEKQKAQGVEKLQASTAFNKAVVAHAVAHLDQQVLGAILAEVYADQTDQNNRAGQSESETYYDGPLRIVRECDYNGVRTPAATPAIIDGILRRGHSLMLTGPTKASKSWLLYGLALRLSTGGVWLGRHQCHRSRVLLVNPELDERSHHRRIEEVRRAYGIDPDQYRDTLDSVTTRGTQLDLAGFVDELEKITDDGRAYDVILVDSIYKLARGMVENAAEDVGELFSQIDRILAMGSAFGFTHHHSKALAGTRDAINRGSGSGVFGRAVDAALDVSPLAIAENSVESEFVRSHSHHDESGAIIKALPLRITYVLREFRTPDPMNILFCHPVHVVDDKGELDRCRIVGSPEHNGSIGGGIRAAHEAERIAETDAALGNIVEQLKAGGIAPTRNAVFPLLNQWRVEHGLGEWSRANFDKQTKPTGSLSWHPSTTAPYALERDIHGGTGTP